jgi:hypothetical protein
MCSEDKSLWQKTACILTYEGSWGDVFINYVLLLINAAACWGAHRRQRRAVSTVTAFGALVFTVSYQIVLCLIVQCSGVSVVWCAMVGWVFHQERGALTKDVRRHPNDDTEERKVVRMLLFTLAIDLASIIYYAVISDPITTVAHICAIIMGILLSWLALRFTPTAAGPEVTHLMEPSYE